MYLEHRVSHNPHGMIANSAAVVYCSVVVQYFHRKSTLMQQETTFDLTVFNLCITSFSVFRVLQGLFTVRKQKSIFQRTMNESTQKQSPISPFAPMPTLKGRIVHGNQKEPL